MRPPNAVIKKNQKNLFGAIDSQNTLGDSIRQLAESEHYVLMMFRT